MKTINLNRKSICMADDIESHNAIIKVSDNCTYLGLIEEIHRSGYLPDYDIMWLMCSENSGFIAAYYKHSANRNIIWQQGFNKNIIISDHESLYFDCELFKKEMWKFASDYEKKIDSIKNRYCISDELLSQIEEYLHRIRE